MGGASAATAVLVAVIASLVCGWTLAALPCNPQVTSVRGNSTLPVDMVNTILRLHNEARYNATPSAVTMPPVQWSEELAIGAQEYLDSCPGFKHSDQTIRRNRYGFVYIGENLAGGMRFDLGGYERACTMWIDERDAWEYGGATCTTNEVCGTCTTTTAITSCGHYTQVVWSTTTHIGCGYAQCASDDIPIYNCWYGAGGNIIGQGPYTSGTRDDTQTCPSDDATDGTTTGAAAGESTTTLETATTLSTATGAAAPTTTTSATGAETTSAAPTTAAMTTPTAAPTGTPGPAAAAPPNGGGDDEGTSGGVIAAAAVGSLIVVGAIAALAVFLIVKKPGGGSMTGASDVEEMMLADAKQPAMVAAPPSAAILANDDPTPSTQQTNRERTMTYSQL